MRNTLHAWGIFSSRFSSLSYLWALSIIVTWVVVAMTLGQPIWLQQSSRDLIAFGVIKGTSFTTDDTWRLVASQWLHVKFPHMLLNAIIIAGVGRSAEARAGGLAPFAVAVAGGTLGQLATLYLEPQSYISGASQACFALCAFRMINGPIQENARTIGWWTAFAGILTGLGLDIFVGNHGHLKPGHFAGLAFGLLAGLLFARAVQRTGTPA